MCETTCNRPKYNLKLDPRRHMFESKDADIMNLLFAASNGDISAVKRHWLGGQDMNGADYDNRTALHLAAAEAHFEIVVFLVETAGVLTDSKDRWGITPLDDAKFFKNTETTDYLEDLMKADLKM